MDEKKAVFEQKIRRPRQHRISLRNIARMQKKYRNMKKARYEVEQGQYHFIFFNLRKLIIATVIVVAVFLLKNIQLSFAQSIVDRIRDVISYQLTIEDMLGQLKYVSDVFPDLKSVFSEGNSSEQPDSAGENLNVKIDLIPPVDGTVVRAFNMDSKDKVINQGIDIESTAGKPVYAAADGEVVATGKNQDSGQYIRIDHGNGLITVYSGCQEIDVSIGHFVKQGDRLGFVSKDMNGQYILHFEVWQNGKPTNPLLYFKS